MKQIIYLSAVAIVILAACGQSKTSSQNNNTPASPAVQMSSGEALFSNNCAVCHALNEEKTGPKLAGVLARWNNDTAQLISYVKNSQQVISSGKNPRITKVYHDYKEALMPPFPNLSENDIRDIINYINTGK